MVKNLETTIVSERLVNIEVLITSGQFKIINLKSLKGFENRGTKFLFLLFANVEYPL